MSGWSHVVAALLLSAATVVAQEPCTTVEIRDPAGLPIPGARVAADGEVVETDDAGQAAVCGADSATVSAPGFEPVTRALSGATLTIQLTELAPAAASVVVTGTLEPRALAEVNRTIRVLKVDGRETVAWSFADMLKQDSAVHVRERGPDGTQADLSIRGSSFDQVLVLVNGLRASDPQTGHHALNVPLPLEAVEQVEVLHGSGATLYGSDAIGGTVNFVTRKPESAELKVMGGLGEFGWNRSAASGAFRKDIWTQTFAYSRDFSTGFRKGRDFRNLAFSTQTFLDTKVGTTSLLFSANDRPFGADQFYGPWDSWEETGGKFFSASQTLGRRSRVQHRLQVGYRRHRDHFILFRYRPEVFQNRHRTESWQVGYSATGGWTSRVRWTAGVQGLSEDIESTNLGDRLRYRAAAFGQLEIRPTERLNVSLGLREEVWERWRVQTSPTAAAGYWLGSGFKARGQFGYAFRIPTFTDLYYSDPATLGNPNLVPERAWNFEGGLDWYGPGGLSASATVFRRLEDGTIDYVRDPGATRFMARNFQDLNFTGGELSARYRTGRGRELWVNYTRLSASQNLPPDAVSRYVFNFPIHQTAAGFQGALGAGLQLKTTLGIYNRTWQTNRALWDVMLAWDGDSGSKWAGWRPFIQATNLTNTQHEAFQGLAQPGRWVRGGVEWRILR